MKKTLKIALATSQGKKRMFIVDNPKDDLTRAIATKALEKVLSDKLFLYDTEEFATIGTMQVFSQMDLA